MLKNKLTHRKSEPRALSSSYNESHRPPSSLSVGGHSLKIVPVTCPPSPAQSALTLTPGRTRNLDQDMEALRLSRQDNPYVQRLINSRESLDCLDDCSSDDTNLMLQEFSSDQNADPFHWPELHEHMIRSPPPVHWPRSPNSRSRVFNFPSSSDEEAEIPTSTYKSPIKLSRFSLGANATGHTISSKLSTSLSSHASQSNMTAPNDRRFTSKIRSLTDLRRQYVMHDDSVQLMSSGDD